MKFIREIFYGAEKHSFDMATFGRLLDLETDMSFKAGKKKEIVRPDFRQARASVSLTRTTHKLSFSLCDI